MRRRGRGGGAPRVLLAASLLALLALAMRPAVAFDIVSTGSRSVGASVVSDTTSYMKLVGASCTCDTLAGCDNDPLTLTAPACSFTVTNLATAGLDYTVTKTCTCLYILSVTESGGEIAIGESTEVKLVVSGQGTNPNPSTATFKIVGTKANVLDAERNGYRVTINWDIL